MIVKKYLLLLLILSFPIFAGPKETLQNRLAKLNSFYAKFKQEVKINGSLIQQGDGQFWLRRPSLFYWEVNTPDQTSIVSDAKDVWVYNPVIEQVSVISINEALDNQLLLLLTDKNTIVWNQYEVTQQGNHFTLTPLNPEAQSFVFGVLPTGMLTDFNVIETDGQTSFYNLFSQSLTDIPMSKFKFSVPNGVLVDDQR